MSDFYPGSRRLILSAEPQESRLDQMGKMYPIPGGSEKQLFSITELASLLNRKPVTIRKWETDEVIPKATYVRPGRNKDPRGRRRLYSRDQVEGILRIAGEEGLLDPTTKKSIAKTQFTSKVFRLFRELARAK
jgi:hypothetical protein